MSKEELDEILKEAEQVLKDNGFDIDGTIEL